MKEMIMNGLIKLADKMDALPNDVELEYSNNTNVNPGDPADTTETTKPTDMPAIYTYAVNLLKYGDSDTDNPLANVTFELYRAGNPDNGIDSATKLNVTKGVDGTYYLEEDGGDTLTTSDTGKLYVKGLERRGQLHRERSRYICTRGYQQDLLHRRCEDREICTARRRENW